MLERTILGNLQIVHSYNQFKIPFQKPLKKKSSTNSIQARSEEPESLNIASAASLSFQTITACCFLSKYIHH